MKKIAMIPVRLGSKRVPNKNLRLLGNKPLIAYAVEAAISSNVFDEIYINSESEVFKEIANKYNVKFYKRPEHLASDDANNDDFALDFMNNVEGDKLIQILATSPFITPEQIIKFTEEALECDTLISLAKVKIESIYKNKPINFNQKEVTTTSQLLEPVYAYACCLMSWSYENYKSNMNKYGAAYHGGDGNIQFFQLEGYATVDIDEEDDFKLAEAIIQSKEKAPQYYKPGDVHKVK